MDTGYVSSQHLKDVIAVKNGEIDRLKKLLLEVTNELEKLKKTSST